MTHICVGKLTIIGSDNGLSPDRRQAIIWTNAGILSIGPLGTKFSEILIAIHVFSFKEIHLKMSSGKWRPSCLGLNVLSDLVRQTHLPRISRRVPWHLIYHINMLFSALVKLCYENITPIMLIRVEYQYQIPIIMFIQRSNIIDHFLFTICIEYFSEAGSFQHKCFSGELYLNLYHISENSIIRHIYFLIIIYKSEVSPALQLIICGGLFSELATCLVYCFAHR